MSEWKDIIGYEGLYQVSNEGEVRSVDRVVPHKKYGEMRLKGKPIAQVVHKSGYLMVSICKDCKCKNFRIHRLVLEAFIGPCPDGCEACHNDGDKTNTKLYNLRWDTIRNNEMDKFKHGTDRGRKVRRGDGIIFPSIRWASRETPNTHQSNITQVCKGKYKTCGGYSWEYV